MAEQGKASEVNRRNRGTCRRRVTLFQFCVQDVHLKAESNAVQLHAGRGRVPHVSVDSVFNNLRLDHSKLATLRPSTVHPHWCTRAPLV